MLENWPGIGYLEFLARFHAFGMVVEFNHGNWETFQAHPLATAPRPLWIPKSEPRKRVETSPAGAYPSVSRIAWKRVFSLDPEKRS
jgi:hypothetical protein